MEINLIKSVEMKVILKLNVLNAAVLELSKDVKMLSSLIVINTKPIHSCIRPQRIGRLPMKGNSRKKRPTY